MIPRILLAALSVSIALAPCAAAAQASAPAAFANPRRLEQLSAAFPEIDRLMREFAERSRPGW
jgi:hypothetical protein